jgi:hypothetical protein
MPNLTTVLENALRDVNEALGIAVVDLQSGLLLGVAHNVPYFTGTYLDAVAAAAVDMFRGKTISTVEKLMTNLRGALVQNMIKEIQMTTDGTYHFMAIGAEKPNALVVLITSRRANMGMGWSAVRSLIPAVAPYCP